VEAAKPPVAAAPVDKPVAVAAAPGKPAAAKGERKAADAPVPPELAADLQAAEQALDGGDAAKALHLARRTLTVKKTARAYALITRAYCKQGDLGNARANLVHTGGEKSSVVRACKKLDVDLTP
jgi:serine/threonine-protein kinase